MSLDKSLKSRASLVRHRNVLNRVERIETLKNEDRWEEGQSPLGLPKVANRKTKVSKKVKAAKTEGAEGGESGESAGTGEAAKT